jgi:amino acid adenylation domain-containing protein
MLEVSKIHHLIELQSKMKPTRTAVVYSNIGLTYQELNQKANQFAHYLIKKQVKSGDIIPIVSDKSLNSLIAILGILKAGAAYTPLNAGSPDKHIEAVFKETKAKFACIESTSVNRFAWTDISPTNIDNMDSLIRGHADTDIDSFDFETDLAYVIYTSGTTGNPKGGMINHANLLPTYYSWCEAYQLADSDIHLQMASFGFDVFVGDWMRALCAGATLVLCPKDILLDSKQLYELIHKEKINCAEFVPAVLRQLINFIEKNNYSLGQFRILVCGSDQWTMKEYRSVKKWCGENTRVISSYGLTETTIDSSFFEEEKTDILLSDNSLVPIGKPFKHVNIYLINDKKLASPGEVGEIYIGGLGVGKGYLNRPELTSERFVANTFLVEIPDKKLYKTGDQGRRLPDGNLEFLGRNQVHVKVNGNRVELPSLEAVINQHPKVKYNVVVPKEGIDKIVLECFMTLNDNSISYEELIEHIKKDLPCYYIPRAFYQIESIPLSSNGKVDRRSIPSQKKIKELKPTLAAMPKNEIQRRLIKIWKEILELEEVSVNNSFHNLGGSSLLYVAMLEKINREFEINLSSITRFETIEQLSTCVEQSIKARVSCLSGKLTPSPQKNSHLVLLHHSCFLFSQQSRYFSSMPLTRSENSFFNYKGNGQFQLWGREKLPVRTFFKFPVKPPLPVNGGFLLHSTRFLPFRILCNAKFAL